MVSKFKEALTVLNCFLKEPKESLFFLRRLPYFLRANQYTSEKTFVLESVPTNEHLNNPLTTYFNNNLTGSGIWKWEHYFDIYHRHFSKFIGKKVNILEIGIYSGGSLGMWKSYFGDGCHVYGVDIESICKVYETDRVSVFIGDQQDPLFWKSFKEKAPFMDIVVDDGGHTTEQQIVTLQEILPHVNAGGVYLCEDLHGKNNHFNSFAINLATDMSDFAFKKGNAPGHLSPNQSFQCSFGSIHFYPFVTVLEKREVALKDLNAPKHGTEWQPISM